ncbi:MAG TPA: asparagine synthase-related protein, partial [Bacteroidota bacterium]
QGFAAPVEHWLRGEWASFVEHALLDSPLVKGKYFARDAVKAVIEENKKGGRLAGQNVWNLLNLSLWHSYWIEGKTV